MSETDSVAEHENRNGDASTVPDRHFGWSNMFVAPAEDPRVQVPSTGERGTLNDFLAGYRQTLELKCQGLNADQLARRSCPPSNLSLLGLIRHVADVERYWFRQVLAGEDAPRRYRTPEDHDGDFNGASADPAVVDDAWTAWNEEVEFAERRTEAFTDLGTTVPMPDDGEEIAVREVLVHMIEEYARHCGHADLLRERIDGRVGQ
jgi:uncharacterized damage-inducible protein DinB